MKYITLLTLLISLTFAYVAVAENGGEIPQILLSEVSFGNAESASNEYIEISNSSVNEWDLEGVSLEYKSKDGSSWQTKSNLSGGIAPYGSFLISNYLESSQEFSGSLASSAGHLRLVKYDAIIDFVAWGEAAEPEVAAAPVHDKTQSLKRLRDEDGKMTDNNNNVLDWFVSDLPSPYFDEWPVVDFADDEHDTIDDPIIEDEPPVDAGQNQDIGDDQELTPPVKPPAQVSASLPLQITELLPDPTSPMTDAEHEFVELLNTNSVPVELAGYVLQSGSEWRYKYTLPGFVLAPGERIAIYSATSGLTLSNSGSQVRVLGPDEAEHSFVEYEKAKAGASWSLYFGEWQWSNPTPNAQNIVPTVTAEGLSGAVVKSANSSQNSAKTAEKLEKKTIDYPEAVSAGDSESDGEDSSGAYIEEEDTPRQINNLILAGIAGLTVMYAVYEYRNDIRIRCQQFARYLKLRTKNWGNS